MALRQRKDTSGRGFVPSLSFRDFLPAYFYRTGDGSRDLFVNVPICLALFAGFMAGRWFGV